MKKAILFSILAVPLLLLGQDLPYTFTVLSETYSDLEGSILISDDEAWDDPDWMVPIGFDFEYMGQTVNELFWGGYDGYGGEMISDNYIGDTSDLIAPLGVDLADVGYDESLPSGSPVSYLLEGSPGSRILKVEWKNTGFYNDDYGSMTANFQMWLYESSNNIEFRYGPQANIDVSTIIDYVGGVIVCMFDDFDWTGYNGAAGGWALSGDPASPTVVNVSSEDDFDYVTLLSAVPADGTVYRFETGIVSVDEKPQAEFYIYPTVSSNTVNLYWPESYNGYSVFDMKGKEVISGFINFGTNTLDISNLSSGVYLVKVQGTESRGTRFIKR